MTREDALVGSPFRWKPGLINVAVITCLLVAASFLPSDTSLSEVKRGGILKVCAPYDAPPLVTKDPEKPGFEIELLAEVAARLDLKLSINRNPAIGADFNPRNWRINRGQCEVVAGGVIDTQSTRSFLQTVPTDVETGWVMIAPASATPKLEAGARVVVLPGAIGLDRTALSRVLRGANIEVVLMRTSEQMRDAITSGAFDVGITDRFSAMSIAGVGSDFQILWLTNAKLPPFSLAIGGWKGDSMLHRAIRGQINNMRKDGELDRIKKTYGLNFPELMASYDMK